MRAKLKEAFAILPSPSGPVPGQLLGSFIFWMGSGVQHEVPHFSCPTKNFNLAVFRRSRVRSSHSSFETPDDVDVLKND